MTSLSKRKHGKSPLAEDSTSKKLKQTFTGSATNSPQDAPFTVESLLAAGLEEEVEELSVCVPTSASPDEVKKLVEEFRQDKEDQNYAFPDPQDSLDRLRDSLLGKYPRLKFLNWSSSNIQLEGAKLNTAVQQEQAIFKRDVLDPINKDRFETDRKKYPALTTEDVPLPSGSREQFVSVQAFYPSKHNNAGSSFWSQSAPTIRNAIFKLLGSFRAITQRRQAADIEEIAYPKIFGFDLIHGPKTDLGHDVPGKDPLTQDRFKQPVELRSVEICYSYASQVILDRATSKTFSVAMGAQNAVKTPKLYKTLVDDTHSVFEGSYKVPLPVLRTRGVPEGSYALQRYVACVQKNDELLGTTLLNCHGSMYKYKHRRDIVAYGEGHKYDVAMDLARHFANPDYIPSDADRKQMALALLPARTSSHSSEAISDFGDHHWLCRLIGFRIFDLGLDPDFTDLPYALQTLAIDTGFDPKDPKWIKTGLNSWRNFASFLSGLNWSNCSDEERTQWCSNISKSLTPEAMGQKAFDRWRTNIVKGLTPEAMGQKAYDQWRANISKGVSKALTAEAMGQEKYDRWCENISRGLTPEAMGQEAYDRWQANLAKARPGMIAKQRQIAATRSNEQKAAISAVLSDIANSMRSRIQRRATADKVAQEKGYTQSKPALIQAAVLDLHRKGEEATGDAILAQIQAVDQSYTPAQLMQAFAFTCKIVSVRGTANKKKRMSVWQLLHEVK